MKNNENLQFKVNFDREVHECIKNESTNNEKSMKDDEKLKLNVSRRFRTPGMNVPKTN